MVGRDQGFDVDQGLHDEGSSLSLFMSAETAAAAKHTTSTPPEHAMLHHVSAVPRDGAVGVSYLLLDSGASVHLVSESMFSSGAAELVEDLGTGGVGCVTATGEDIQIRRKAKVRVRLALCASSSSSPASVPVTFEALVAPDVRFSLLSLGLLLRKGWSVSFGSEPRAFGPKVSRGRPRSELRVEGFQNCFWLVCSTGSTPQVTAVMPEISAPPASSSVCTPPQLPDGIQLRLRERVASTRQEGGPTESAERVRVGDSRVGSEGRRVSSDRVGEGSTGFEGRDSRVSAEGSRGSTPATAASGTEDTATGAGRRVCGSDGGGGANATEGCSKGQGFPSGEGSPEGQHRQAERRQGQGKRAQGGGDRCWEARQQHAEGKGAAEAATDKGSPEETLCSKRPLQRDQDGSRESCAEGCEKGSPQASAGLIEVQSSTREEVVGLPEKAQRQAAEGANPKPKRHEKLEEEAKSFAQLLERHGSTNQYEARFPQVDLSIAAGRAEVTTRAMVEITDKTSYTSPMPAHRQHPPPPPPPDVTMGEPAGTVPGSPSSFSLVTGPEAPKTPRPEAPKTPDAGTAALETPAPSSPPTTTLNVSKKARTEEPQEREMAMASASAPASPPPTRLAARTTKTSSPGSHKLPPGVSWDDL